MPSEFHDSMTLGEARAVLRDVVEDGADCPCCRRFAKIYTRKLNHVPAATLIALYRTAGRDWAHVPTIVRSQHPGFANQGGYTVLSSHWGLIEEERARREDGGRAGFWRVTDRGERFINREVSVLSHARVYDDRLLALVGEPVKIDACLGKRFDYDELMATTITEPRDAA